MGNIVAGTMFVSRGIFEIHLIATYKNEQQRAGYHKKMHS